MTASNKKSLRYHWIASGLASAFSRFVPIPVVDGLIEERARRHSLDQTLDHHSRKFAARDVESLYTSDENRKGWIATKLKQLALYPVRKVAVIATASAGVPKDFARTYLLARAIDICLTHDLLPNSATPEARTTEAKKIRDAFDSAFDNLDEMLFQTISRVVRREFAEIKPEARKALNKLTRRSVKSKSSSRKNENTSKDALSSTEDEAEFAQLAAQFDELFRNELAKRNLDIEIAR